MLIKPEGFYRGGGVDSSGGMTPAKCRKCGKPIPLRKAKQSIQICPKCVKGKR